MPGDACLSFNLDSELFWLRVDALATDRFKTLSIGQYGLLRGVPRILSVLERTGIPSTWFVPGFIAHKYPGVVEAIRSAGHEIGSRSWDHRELAGQSVDRQQESIERGMAELHDLLGERTRGIRAPTGEVDNNTFRAMALAGVEWSSTLRSDELPCAIDAGLGRPIVEIGSRWELTDYAHFQFNYRPAYPVGQSRIASYSDVLNDWTDDAIATTARNLPCVFTLTPDVIGKPGRALLLERLLDSLREASVTFTTLGAIAADAAESGVRTMPC